MEPISELLVGSDPSAGSAFGVVMMVIVIALAVALLAYLLRCYIQDALMCKRVKRLVFTCRTKRVPPRVLSQTKRLRAKSSGILPSPHRNGAPVKLRGRSRHPHPWKRNRFNGDSSTPR